MQDFRHVFIILLSIIEAVLFSIYFKADAITLVIERDIFILIVIFINSILIYLLFSSIIMSVLYYFSLYMVFMFIGINLLSLTYFLSYIVGTSFALLGYLFINRSFNDNFILNLKNFKLNINIFSIVLSTIFVIILFLFIHNVVILIGSLFNIFILSVSGEIVLSPLTLASWIATPYLLSQLGEIKTNKGICIGKINGVLRRSTVELGKIKTSTKYKWSNIKSNFCIDLDNSKNYNIVIVGTSGSGKSSLAKVIVSKLNVSYLIFDIHGEYFTEAKRIDASLISVNPLSLFGQSPRQRALEVAYMLKSIFNLGNLQVIDLFNVIFEAYEEKGIYEEDSNSWNNTPPNFRDVILLLEKKKKYVTNSSELNKIQSLEPYLNFVSNSMFYANSINYNDIFKDNYILDLSKITIPEIKYIVIETILRSLTSFMYSTGTSKLRKMIVIDEAPFILSKESGQLLMERLFAEGRKFGIGFILISQTSEYIKKLLSNSAYLFALNLVEPADLDYVSRIISGPDQDIYKSIYDSLHKLDRGLIITRNILQDEIFLVRIQE
jgi:Cdc6-like AAA superfamily ATPase